MSSFLVGKYSPFSSEILSLCHFSVSLTAFSRVLACNLSPVLSIQSLISAAFSFKTLNAVSLFCPDSLSIIPLIQSFIKGYVITNVSCSGVRGTRGTTFVKVLFISSIVAVGFFVSIFIACPFSLSSSVFNHAKVLLSTLGLDSIECKSSARLILFAVLYQFMSLALSSLIVIT